MHRASANFFRRSRLFEIAFTSVDVFPVSLALLTSHPFPDSSSMQLSQYLLNLALWCSRSNSPFGVWSMASLVHNWDSKFQMKNAARLPNLWNHYEPYEPYVKLTKRILTSTFVEIQNWIFCIGKWGSIRWLILKLIKILFYFTLPEKEVPNGMMFISGFSYFSKFFIY